MQGIYESLESCPVLRRRRNTKRKEEKFENTENLIKIKNRVRAIPQLHVSSLVSNSRAVKLNQFYCPPPAASSSVNKWTWMQPVWMKTFHLSEWIFHVQLWTFRRKWDYKLDVSRFYCLLVDDPVDSSSFSSQLPNETSENFSAFLSTRFNFPLLQATGKHFSSLLEINLNYSSSILGERNGNWASLRSRRGIRVLLQRIMWKTSVAVEEFRSEVHEEHFSHFNSWANFAFSTGKSHFWFQLIPTPLARDYNLFIAFSKRQRSSDERDREMVTWLNGEAFH